MRCRSWPYGSWPYGSLRPRSKRAEEWPVMGCRELTSGAGPALLTVAARCINPAFIDLGDTK